MGNQARGQVAAPVGFWRIHAATRVAQKRTQDFSISVRVNVGRYQIVRATYDAKGKSTISPVTDWLDGEAAIAELLRMGKEGAK